MPAASSSHRALETPSGDIDWRCGLPTLVGPSVTLREGVESDAMSLLAMLSTEQVSRYIAPPPSTIEGFGEFLSWGRAERSAGRYLSFVVVPHGCDAAVGLFQVRRVTGRFEIAEWGFLIGAEFWGTGVFQESARAVLDFLFGTVGVRRLEARTAVENPRGNGALAKLGARQEGVLRQGYLRYGHYHDQALWSILREDWMEARVVWGPPVHGLH
jgi:RimJ/RimL family protein N-acetyltransferase